MRISLNRLQLASVLAVAAPVASRKTTMPILNNVLLVANGKLDIAATDLSIAYSSSLPCDADGEVTLALPAQKLHDAVASMTDKDLRLDVDGLNVELRSGRSRFKIAGLDPRDFPKRMDTAQLTFHPVPMSELRFLVEKVEFACNPKNHNIALQGIGLNLAEGISAAADGYSCSVVRGDVQIDVKPVHAPKEALRHVLRAFEAQDTVEVAVGRQQLYARSGDALVGIALLEEAFPQERVLGFIRRESPHMAVVERTALIEALKRVGLMATAEHGLPVDFDLDPGSLRLRSDFGGEAEDEIAVEYDGFGTKFRIAAKFVVAALEAMSAQKVTLGVSEEQMAPVYLAPVGDEEHDVVIMPMRRD